MSVVILLENTDKIVHLLKFSWTNIYFLFYITSFSLSLMNIQIGPPYPFFPPFLRDSAGVMGGEGERLLFFPAELALRSLRSGVREDWSDKPRAAQGARDGGWEKEPQNERMERLHTQGGEAVGEQQQGRERMPWRWRRRPGFPYTVFTQRFSIAIL